MTPNTYGVLKARLCDAPAIREFLLGHYYPEAALQPISIRKVDSMIGRCVSRDRAMAGIIMGDGGIEASVGISIEEFDYSEHPHLEARWLSVHPDHRHSTHLQQLLKFADWAAEQMGVPAFLGVLTDKDLIGKMRLYQRRMPQVGAMFAAGVQDGRFYSQLRMGDGRADPDRDGGRNRGRRSHRGRSAQA